MAKIALLIGVSEYGPGLNPLPSAVRDVEAMQEVLQPLEIGSFDQVKRLSNPNPPVMREAIETLFSGRSQDDLLLLLFSGYVICDHSGKLYFATTITRQSPRAELIRVSAIPISFVQQIMNSSPCQRQVVILDCCLSGVSEQEMAENHDVVVDINTQLGGKERTILASFTYLQNSPNFSTSSHSIYTNYLVEGIRTKAADLDSDGWITVNELHEYALQRTQIADPAIRVEFYPVANGDKILLFQLPFEQQMTLKLANFSQSEAQADQRTHVDSQSQINSVTTGQKTVLQQATRLLPVEPNNSPKSVTTGQKTVLQQATRLLPDLPTEPTSASSDQADQPTQVDSQSQPNLVTTGTKTVLQQSTHILPLDANKPPTSAVKSSSLIDAKTNHFSVSSFSTKLLLVTGIGGAFVTVTLAWAIAISTRKPVTPPADAVSKVSSSPITTPKSSPTVAKSGKKSSPKPTASPKSKDCTIFVNGNLRSTPISAQDNVVESLKKRLPITGKRTDDDWVQVKLSNGKLAWAHPGIISKDSEKEMEACLAKKKKKKT